MIKRNASGYSSRGKFRATRFAEEPGQVRENYLGCEKMANAPDGVAGNKEEHSRDIAMKLSSATARRGGALV